MNPFDYFLGALALIGLSCALKWQTSPFADCGAEAFHQRRFRRMIGTVVAFMAGFSAVVGVVSEVILANP